MGYNLATNLYIFIKFVIYLINFVCFFKIQGVFYCLIWTYKENNEIIII